MPGASSSAICTSRLEPPGLATRRAHAVPVAAMSQGVGLLLVLLGLLVVPGAASGSALPSATLPRLFGRSRQT